MVEGIWKLASFIIMVLLLMIYPLMQLLETQDDVIQMRVVSITADFIDQVRSQGMVTPQVYREFDTQLQGLGHHFKIKLIHEISVFVPKYGDFMDASTFTGEMILVKETIDSASITNVLYPSLSIPEDDIRRQYTMSSGDYFGVEVTVNQRTQGQVLRDMIWLTHSNYGRFYARFGGLVGYAID